MKNSLDLEYKKVIKCLEKYRRTNIERSNREWTRLIITEQKADDKKKLPWYGYCYWFKSRPRPLKDGKREKLDSEKERLTLKVSPAQYTGRGQTPDSHPPFILSYT